MDKIQKYIDDNPHYIDIHPDEGLSSDELALVIRGDGDDVRNNIVDRAYDFFHQGEDSWYYEELRKDLGLTEEDIVEYLEVGYGPDIILTDREWEKLLDQTEVHITARVKDANVNFDPWSHNSRVEYSEIKEMLKVLGINPIEFGNLFTDNKIEEKFTGWLPDLEREAKVDVKDMVESWGGNYYGELNFLIGNLEGVISKGENVTFKAGTPVVLYDHYNGATLTETALIAPLTLPRDSIEFTVDDDYGYGIQDCCGYTEEHWKKGEIDVRS